MEVLDLNRHTLDLIFLLTSQPPLRHAGHLHLGMNRVGVGYLPAYRRGMQ